MKVRRVYILTIALTLLFGVLLYRLGDIQLFSVTSFGPNRVNLLEESVKQRAYELQLFSGRGTILDRHGEPITNRKTYDVIVFPFSDSYTWSVEKIARIINISPEKLAFLSESTKKPYFLSEKIQVDMDKEQFQALRQVNIPFFVPVEIKNSRDPLVGKHFVGLVRENPDLYQKRYGSNRSESEEKKVGISGLQRAFDSFLLSKGDEKVLFHVDARGTPLFGYNYRYARQSDSFFPVNVQSTLDLTLQKKAEQLMDDYSIGNGALVLLDVKSREVLVMVSRPQVNEHHPYQDGSIKNQALIAHFPGSVFKTVVAAAAIENMDDVFERTFNCDQNVYGDGDSERKLGKLNFEESFTFSCNRTFAELAEELMKEDEKILDQYAERLGILGPAGWTGDLFRIKHFQHFPAEQTGNIWGDPYDRLAEKAIHQTAIGQKEVRATPLAVANMMATIADHGIQKEVLAARKIVYKNGTTMHSFEEQIKDRGLKRETVKKMTSLLRSVVEKGTARSLNSLPVAGKTGTAETGKEDLTHHWMAGFFPYEEPKYALVVVGLNQKKQPQVLRIYEEMVKFLQARDDRG